MKGYIINTGFVILGTLGGLFIGKRISDELKGAIFNTLGLFTLFIGIKMALSCHDIIPTVFCLAIGTFIGTVIKMEEHVNLIFENLTEKYQSTVTNLEGFITATTLFCVGSMTIIGSIKDGLYNDATLIKTKSVMDGFASLILSAKYGTSVLFSALSVFIIQGLLTHFSTYLTFLSSTKMMGLIDGVGGIIVLGIGINLLGLKQIKTLNMLPALLLIVLYGLFQK